MLFPARRWPLSAGVPKPRPPARPEVGQLWRERAQSGIIWTITEIHQTKGREWVTMWCSEIPHDRRVPLEWLRDKTMWTVIDDAQELV
jgi:hypothetical protein